MGSSSTRPDYGIDAPGVVRNLFLFGVGLPILGWFVPALHFGPVTFLTRPMTYTTGFFCFVEAVLMLLYAKVGKFRHRDRMLNTIHWKGTETVLDVGTGRGLLMIGAAKRLTTGKSVGIDIWSAKDLSGNTMERTLRNMELEGVRDKTEVQNGDAIAMKFPENSFDVILSNVCIHNIPGRAARDQACREIVRVLKPGGKALISDFIHTAHYVKAFRAAGATASRTGFNFLFTFPWLRIVEVEKNS